jgi:hypothetical protein
MISDEMIAREVVRTDKFFAFYDKFINPVKEFPLDRKFRNDLVNLDAVALAIEQALAKHNAFRITENIESNISLFVDYTNEINRGGSKDDTNVVLTLWTDSEIITITFEEFERSGYNESEAHYYPNRVRTHIGVHGITAQAIITETDNEAYAEAVNNARHFTLDNIVGYLETHDI